MAVVESGAVQFQAACCQGAAAVVGVAAANVGAAGEDGALAVVETAAFCFQAAEGQTAAVGQFAVYVQIGAAARFDGAAVVQTAGDADAAVGRIGNRGVAAVAVIAVAVRRQQKPCAYRRRNPDYRRIGRPGGSAAGGQYVGAVCRSRHRQALRPR